MDVYVSCEYCKHENFIDDGCEVQPILYVCGHCGKELEKEVKWLIAKGIITPFNP